MKDFECIMVPPPRRKKLTSQTWEVELGRTVRIEGFDENGPNGITAEVFIPHASPKIHKKRRG